MPDRVATDIPKDWDKIRRALESAFLPSEVRVLGALWARANACCVRDIQPDFPGVSYTTLMTSLDRLFKKGALDRQKKSRAFYYRTKASPEQMVADLAGAKLAGMLHGRVDDLRPIFSQLVDNLARCDESLLDELEELVRARRRALKEPST